MLKFVFLFLSFSLILPGLTMSQNNNIYYAQKTCNPIQIDGKLNEDDWQEALFTEPFVLYLDGKKPVYETMAKILWDENYFYIGFYCKDSNVQAEIKKRDGVLWKEDVVEIFCDPDGSGNNYIEIQINPQNTVTDMLLNKPYSEGGRPKLDWDMEGLRTSVYLMGAINDTSIADTAWYCEAALPFQQIYAFDSKQRAVPSGGDTLRLLLTRYQYLDREGRNAEISSWLQTDRRGFHAPDKFGHIILKDKNQLKAE